MTGRGRPPPTATTGGTGVSRAPAAQALLDAIVTCAPLGFALFDRELRYLRINDALAEINGLPAERHIGHRPMDLLPGVPADAVTSAFRRVLDTGRALPGIETAGSTPARPGVERRWLASWYPVREDDEIVAVGVFVADITDRSRAERRLALVADVGEALDATLGVDERLGRLADLLVPALGDFCTIDVTAPGGGTRLVACAHVEAASQAALRRLRDRAAGDPALPPGLGGAPRRDTAQLVELTPAAVEAAADASAEGDALLALAPRALIVAPVVARGRPLGAVTLGIGPSGRRYDDGDLELVAQLARRAGLAIDNARLYEEQRHIARTLQRAMLPPALPRPPGLDVAARFSPMAGGTELGGDFYDLFAAGESWVATIGDVCGKGAEAAALTSLARHGLRALGRSDPMPSRALGELNDVVVGERGLDPRFSTVAYARLTDEGEGVRLTVASAGHPLPLVVRGGGRVEAIGTPGTLIGPFAEVRVADRSDVLGEGDAVVLYTDGVTEARRDGELFGDERLADVLAERAGAAADDIAGAVERAAVAWHRGPLDDDLAVLVLRVTGVPLR